MFMNIIRHLFVIIFCEFVISMNYQALTEARVCSSPSSIIICLTIMLIVMNLVAGYFIYQLLKSIIKPS